MSHQVRDYYEVNIEFGQSFVHLRRDGVAVFNGDLSPDELSVVTIMSDCLRQLRAGKSLAYGFDPTYLYNSDDDCHCKWTDRGYLIISDEKPPRRFKHARTATAALTRHGAFTTSRSIAYMLPRFRTAEMIQAAKDAAAQRGEAIN